MQELIIAAWSDRELLKNKKYSDAVHTVIEELDKGKLRTRNNSDSKVEQRTVHSEKKSPNIKLPVAKEREGRKPPS